MTFEKFKCNYFNNEYKTEEILKYLCVKFILINSIIKQLLEEGGIDNAYKEKDSCDVYFFIY